MKIQMAVAASLLFLSPPAWALRAGEVQLTGTVTRVDPVARKATIQPVSGAPVDVQFVWNVGGVCSICLGGGLLGPTFDQQITQGRSVTVVYTPSYPDGGINTVNRLLKEGQADPGAPRAVSRSSNLRQPRDGAPSE